MPILEHLKCIRVFYKGETPVAFVFSGNYKLISALPNVIEKRGWI